MVFRPRILKLLMYAFVIVVFYNAYFIWILSTESRNSGDSKAEHRNQVSRDNSDVPKAKSGHSNLNNEVPMPIFKAASKAEYSLNRLLEPLVREVKSTNYSSRNISVRSPLYSLVKSIRKELEEATLSVEKSWKLASKWVSSRSVIPDSTTHLGSVLRDLRNAKILKAQVPKLGTQLKVLLTLQGGQQVLFKPQWYARDYIESGPEVYNGWDRHNGEIAAFYLSLLLDLRRVPLVSGRILDLQKELLPVAEPRLKATFFQNERNQTCFYGVCYYCKPAEYVCGQDGFLEGAVVLWLPPHIKLAKFRSPWQRTYKKNVAALWETSDDYCSLLQRNTSLFRSKRGQNRLLDLIETSIFDFLIQNGDRHHYEVMDNAGDGVVLLIDNGKSFGNPNIDHLDILAPLVQCCTLRPSLVQRLKLLRGHLSQAFELVTDDHILSPLLAPKHYEALDRRLAVVLVAVDKCSQSR